MHHNIKKPCHGLTTKRAMINLEIKMYKISDKVINFITKAMEKCKVEFAAGRKTVAEVKIH